MTDIRYMEQLRQPTPEDPLRILMSACLAGRACGADGSSYGSYPAALRLLDYTCLRIVRFCPEDVAFGTPRAMCDIHGGTGADVLDGRAKVLTDAGEDWTAPMIGAAAQMLALARLHDIELAVLMDISAACGSQVIYDGSRRTPNKRYQAGAGVCAALLLRNGFKVISQRDFACLEVLYAKADPAHTIDCSKTDHHDTDWYRDYFKTG